MPKQDGVRRMDNAPTRFVKAASPDYGLSQAGGNNADMLDGYHATTVPSPNAIPVTDGAGYVSPFINPDNALTANQGAAWSGMRYIAPSGRLMDKITAADEYIIVSAPLFAGDESAILSHYSVPNEKVWIMGAASTDGKQWRYAIERGKGGTAAQAFPAGSEVINLGSASTGGFIYTSSAQNTDSPFIAMRQNNDDANRSSTWKLQLGKLSSVPETFKALFPQVTNWDTFGGASENWFASGGFYARYGSIVGDLDVTGRFTVNDTQTNARMQVGEVATGFGQAFYDANGQPVWSVIMPYPDTDGNRESDIVWTVNSFGERAIYFRRVGSEWVLSLGGFDVTSTSLTNGEFGIYPGEQRIQFAEGLSLAWNAGLDKLTWPGYFDTYGMVAEYGVINSSLVNNGHTETVSLSVSGTDAGSFAMYGPPSFQYTSSYTAGAEVGTLAIVQNGQTVLLKTYAIA